MSTTGWVPCSGCGPPCCVPATARACSGLARFAASIKATARLEAFTWQPDGRVALTVSAWLVRGDDETPLKLRRRDGRFLLVLADAPEPAEPTTIDVTDDLSEFAAELALRNRETGVEWPCPATFSPTVVEDGPDHVRVVLRGSGFVSADAVRSRGRISRGMWDVWVPLRGLGLVRKARLGQHRDPDVDAACQPALLGSPARAVIPSTSPTRGGNLTLDVAGRSKRLAGYLDAQATRRTSIPRPELSG